MNKIQPVILAGGTGTRLWPLSRELYPKQLLNLTEDKSLLQATILRIMSLPDMLPPLVVIVADQASRLQSLRFYTVKYRLLRQGLDGAGSMRSSQT